MHRGTNQALPSLLAPWAIPPRTWSAAQPSPARWLAPAPLRTVRLRGGTRALSPTLTTVQVLLQLPLQLLQVPRPLQLPGPWPPPLWSSEVVGARATPLALQFTLVPGLLARIPPLSWRTSPPSLGDPVLPLLGLVCGLGKWLLLQDRPPSGELGRFPGAQSPLGHLSAQAFWLGLRPRS